MSKADKFRKAIEKIETKDADAEYMSDMAHWCVVHVTNYMPRTNPDGSLYITTKGMVTDFEVPRTTVHVTLNHTVAAHGYGSWDDKEIVVIAPYNDVVKKNGNPAEIAGTDTYWSVSPDTGLLLPKSAYIIQPDDNGPLFKIGKNGATYKRDNYTEEEVAMIESMLSPVDMDEYIKYKNGDIDESSIEHIGIPDKRVKKMYESAKDKKAFLRGLFEEARFGILSKYLRDAVVKMSMEKMGFKWNEARDDNEASKIIAKVAWDHGIEGNASNKGHSNSFYGNIEDFNNEFYSCFQESAVYGPGILKTDAQSLYGVLTERLNDYLNPILLAVVYNLIDNKPIDFMKMYENCYKESIDNKMSRLDERIHQLEDDSDMYFRNDFNLDEETNNRRKQEVDQLLAEQQKRKSALSKKKTLATFDKNLYETVKRHCKVLTREYNAWRDKIIKSIYFADLVKNLRAFIAVKTMARGGREDY